MALNLNKNTNCPLCETQNKIKYIESLGFKVIEFKTFGLVAKCKNNHIFKRDFNNFKKGQHKCPLCENENKIEFLTNLGYEILSENLSHNLIIKCKNGHIINKIFDKTANFECSECKKQEKIDFLKSLGFVPISQNLNNNLVIKCKNNHIFNRCYGNILKGAILCPICYPSSSSFENEIATILPNYIKNDYSILKNKELDFYIPEYNLAIECNGSYWHSTKFKDKWYHLNKTIKCLEKGIKLIQIFEDEWYNNKDKWINIINSYILKNKPKLFKNIHIANLCYDLWDYSEFGYKLIQFDYPKLVNNCWDCGYYIWAKSP